MWNSIIKTLKQEKEILKKTVGSSKNKVVTEEDLRNVIGKDLAAKVVKDASKNPDRTQ